MAAGRRGALSVVVVMIAALAPLLLAGVARADCFDYCFKNCIANDKTMTDYCNYACDKTCAPGAPQRPLAAAAAGNDIGCQLSCARTSCNRLGQDCKAVETCFGACYDGCKSKPLPRPLRAGAGGSVSTASGPIFSSSSEPDKDGATTKKHPFHEKQDGVRPSSEAPGKDDAATDKHPFHEKQDGVRPSSEAPGKDDAATEKHPFHEKQDSVRPSSEAPGKDDAATEKHPFHEKQDGVRPSSEAPSKDDAAPEKHPFHEKQDGFRPSSEAPGPDAAGLPGKASSSLNCNFHEKQDGVQPASEQQLTPLSEIHAAPPAPL